MCTRHTGLCPCRDVSLTAQVARLPSRRYYTPRLTAHALQAPNLERGYYKVWQGLKNHFAPPATNGKAENAAARA